MLEKTNADRRFRALGEECFKMTSEGCLWLELIFFAAMLSAEGIFSTLPVSVAIECDSRMRGVLRQRYNSPKKSVEFGVGCSI